MNFMKLIMVFLILLSLPTFAQKKIKAKNIISSTVKFYPKVKKIDIDNKTKLLDYKVTVENLTDKSALVDLKFVKPTKIKAGKNNLLTDYVVDGQTKDFTLGPRERRVINIKFRIPENYEGSKYLGYSFYGKIKGQKKNSLNIIQRDMGLLILRKPSTEKKSIAAKVKTKYNKQRLSVDYNMENTGNSFLKNVKVTGILMDMKTNKILDKFDLGAKRKDYIPQGNKRKYSGISSQKLKKGKYKLLINLVDYTGFSDVTMYEFKL